MLLWYSTSKSSDRDCTFSCNILIRFFRYVNPVGLDNLLPHYKFYVVYCVWLAVELTVVYFFFIETKGPTLEEVAKIFDGENAEVGLATTEEVKGDIGFVPAVHIEDIGVHKA